MATVLCGDLTKNTRLRSSKSYVLACPLYVKPNVTLTLDAGVTITATPADSLGAPPVVVVLRGAKINAQGTQANPITFTALVPDVYNDATVITDTAYSNTTVLARHSGKWGGLFILGRAPTSHGYEPTIEGLADVYYGGTDPYDSSGVLRYVRVRVPRSSGTAPQLRIRLAVVPRIRLLMCGCLCAGLARWRRDRTRQRSQWHHVWWCWLGHRRRAL